MENAEIINLLAFNVSAFISLFVFSFLAEQEEASKAGIEVGADSLVDLAALR